MIKDWNQTVPSGAAVEISLKPHTRRTLRPVYGFLSILIAQIHTSPTYLCDMWHHEINIGIIRQESNPLDWLENTILMVRGFPHVCICSREVCLLPVDRENVSRYLSIAWNFWCSGGRRGRRRRRTCLSRNCTRTWSSGCRQCCCSGRRWRWRRGCGWGMLESVFKNICTHPVTQGLLTGPRQTLGIVGILIGAIPSRNTSRWPRVRYPTA